MRTQGHRTELGALPQLPIRVIAPISNVRRAGHSLAPSATRIFYHLRHEPLTLCSIPRRRRTYLGPPEVRLLLFTVLSETNLCSKSSTQRGDRKVVTLRSPLSTRTDPFYRADSVDDSTFSSNYDINRVGGSEAGSLQTQLQGPDSPTSG